jgi:hypothetical protein
MMRQAIRMQQQQQSVSASAALPLLQLLPLLDQMMVMI